MKTKFIYVLLGVFFLINQNSSAEEDLSQSSVETNQIVKNNISYLPYMQFGGTKFFNLDTAKAALGADLFVPIWQEPSKLVFTHIRFFDRSGKPFEGNIHLGYRYLVPEKDHLYGIYGAFDRKRTDFGNYFNQLTFGVEGWFRNLFIGGNFYQPVGGASKFIGITNELAQFDRIQNNIWITYDKQYEKAMRGGDAEIGYELVSGLVGYIGGYYFSAKNIATICGPKVRFIYDWFLENGKRILGVFDKFGLEGGIQKDKPRGTTYYLSANTRIGLLPNRESILQGVARHMTDLVRRDVDIISSNSFEGGREVYKDMDGNILKVLELSGDVQTQLIDEDSFSKALADPTIKILSVKGHVNSVPESVTIDGDKMAVFGNELKVISPITGNILQVDLSSSKVAEGSISENAANVLLGNSDKHPRKTNDQRMHTSKHYKGVTILIPKSNHRPVYKTDVIKVEDVDQKQKRVAMLAKDFRPS